MKKGLRLFVRHPVVVGALNGHKPYEEGIKTHAGAVYPDAGRNGHKPYEEGIKTKLARVIRVDAVNGHKPYEEGIKTVDSVGLGFVFHERTQTL